MLHAKVYNIKQASNQFNLNLIIKYVYIVLDYRCPRSNGRDFDKTQGKRDPDNYLTLQTSFEMYIFGFKNYMIFIIDCVIWHHNFKEMIC